MAETKKTKKQIVVTPKRTSLYEKWQKISLTNKILFPFSFVVGLGAAIKTWIDYDLWQPASVQYVKTETKPIKPAIRDIQIELNEGKLEQIDELIFKWGREMKNKKNGDLELIRGRIQELERNKENYKRNIEDLRKQKH